MPALTLTRRVIGDRQESDPSIGTSSTPAPAGLPIFLQLPDDDELLTLALELAGGAGVEFTGVPLPLVVAEIPAEEEIVPPAETEAESEPEIEVPQPVALDVAARATPADVETPAAQPEKQPAEPAPGTEAESEDLSAVEEEEAVALIAEESEAQPAVQEGEAAAAETATTTPAATGIEELAAWTAGIRQASHSVTQPEIVGAGTGATTVQAHATTVAGGRAARRVAIPQEAAAAVPAPPVVENPPPAPEPEPPELTPVYESLHAAATRNLSDQRLPDLVRSPRGTLPSVPGAPGAAPPAPARPGSTTSAVEPTAAVGAAATPTQSTGDQQQLQRLEQAGATSPVATVTPQPGEGVTLQDTGPQPFRPLPPRFQASISGVLAQLLAEPGPAAEAILHDARVAAFPNSALQNEFPEIGSENLESITADIETSLRRIATEAGIAEVDLNTQIDTRRAELERQRLDEQTQTSSAHTAATEQISSEADQTSAMATGAQHAIDDHVDLQVEAAQDPNDPSVIRARRDRLARRMDDDLTAGIVRYSQAAQRRGQEISRAIAAQRAAYTRAADQDERELLAEARRNHTDEAVAKATAVVSHTWADTKGTELTATATTLRTAAVEEADRLTTELRTARRDAGAELRLWSDALLDEHESWWESLFRMFEDWGGTAHAEAAATATIQAGENRDSIVQSDLFLTDFIQKHGEDVDLNSAEVMTGLSEEQQAIIRSYYGTPDRNPLRAMAAGLQVRVSVQKRAGLVEQMNGLLGTGEFTDWQKLDRLGQAQRSSFSATSISGSLRHAMFGGVTGWGTDEALIFSSLAGLTPVQAKAVRGCYSADYNGADLDADIASELSGAELTRANAQLAGDQTLADVATLREAMEGGVTGLGTDEDTIMSVLRGKSDEERRRISEVYFQQYGRRLEEHLNDELDDGFSSHHDSQRAAALMAGNTDLADAIAVDDAMRGGITGWGTDRDAIEGVYNQIRNDVRAEADAHHWTTEQMEAEIRRRNSSVETSYNARYGAEWTGEGSALRQAFHDEESGPEAELYDALADNDLTRADAARLAIEEDAIFVSSDEAINGVFRHQYERALEEVRRDQGPALRAALDAEEAEARRAGTPWDPYERRRRERMMERELETRARGVSAGYMGDLETTFETDFSRRGTIGMEMLIGMNMSGYEQDRARDLVAQGGYLTPAQEVHYAVAGTGTDEEALRRALENRSPEEIAEIRAEYARTHPGHTLDADIHDDVDGRDRFDLDMALEGEPQNAEQELDQMHRRVDWELTNSADVWGGGESRSVLTHRRDEMARAYAATVDPSLTPEERVRALERFHYTAGNTTVAVQDYRRQMDALTDTIATVAGVVAAVVVIVVATIATGGAAGPGLIAALVTTMSSGGIAAASAAATVLATIAVKQAMLGGAYGWEDVGFDVAVGLVDVAANYFTAGIGGRLLDALETVPPGMLARMAVSPRRATRMLAHAIAESAEGLVSTLPSALAGNVLRDENWRGNAFQNILLGTAMETGMGTLMSGGLGSLGGFKRMSVPSGHPAAEMLAPNRTFRQQLSDMRAFRETNPTGRMRDFLAWQQGRSVREAMEQQLSAAAEREARDQLLSGMSAAERHQFADTPIRVMDDADFVRFTGSTKGNAVVVIDAGEPRVIMRAGADPSVMREEGVHLLQSIDPRTRGAVRALDETNLAGWRQMDLGRQLDLYGQKIDLEIDAHRRLIGSLEDSLDDAGGDAALRRSLETQIDRARQNLDNLTSRRADLGDITPEQRVRMSEGAEPRPQYLDEPPRLFSKDPTTPHPDTAAEAAGTARPMRADPNLERTPVTDSPLRKVKGEPDRPVYRIGPEWDAPHEGRLRKYRQVEVLDAEGRVARVREEILLDDGNWVQRGSESTRAGAAAEAASEEVTREQAARAAARGDRVIAVKTQNPDGSGFDGAQLELNADGSARIAVIEVKNYNGYVPRSEFTAVVENLQRNLDDLRAQLDSVDALTRFGITHEQQQALLAALDDGKIRLELRLAPGTQLGSYSSGSVIRDIKQAWRDAGISSNVPVKTVPIPETHMATARTRIGQMDNLGGRPRFYDLATRPDGTVSPESLGHAKVAMLAEQSGIVKPPITRTIQPGTFVDAGGQVTTVSRLQGSHLKGSAESDTVRGIIQQLRLEAPVPGGAGLTPRILLLDITGLSPVERARLRQVIREAMENLPGRDGMLRRLHLFERP